MQRVDVDRKEHAEGDQKKLRALVDAEPENDKRDRGILRIICTVESVSRSLRSDSPLARPRAKPIPPPTTRPAMARRKLISTLRGNSPERVNRHAASATASGDGSTAAESIPKVQAACQTASSSIGSSHGAMSCRSANRSRFSPNGRRSRSVFPPISVVAISVILLLRFSPAYYSAATTGRYAPTPNSPGAVPCCSLGASVIPSSGNSSSATL